MCCAQLTAAGSACTHTSCLPTEALMIMPAQKLPREAGYCWGLVVAGPMSGRQIAGQHPPRPRLLLMVLFLIVYPAQFLLGLLIRLSSWRLLKAEGK